MKLNKRALRSACFRIAKSTMWELKPVALDSIQKHADHLFDIAMKHEASIGEDRDPNILVRAVLYLEHTHAIPPRGDNVRWFDEMLEALIELACPNIIANRRSGKFYQDIEDGIAIARNYNQK